ncbi:thioredoxin family protein [Pseudomaricurvus sp. HS19]|uniref:thioredoxin family protein n=1 Tax=Pseudomaricurvus sp. HS19 TaxID=2692626 RepID=UPI00136AB04B|nr:thioredoxin family protein [Pseudomaricurvus sp. HS19]MYM62632.1 thioredoxin family protein [Pseudomaricurvus sp. HS19]
MREIKVLGSGCTKCTKTAESISRIAAELGVEANIIKETSPQAMMSYGVMSTPAVVVDEQLVHSGSIPHREQIEGWLRQP